MTAAPSAGTLRGRTLLGLVLVIVGSILTLESAGILRTEGLGRWWPLILIGVGVVKVRQPLEDGQRALGVAFLLVGGLLQLTSIVSSSWPLLMVALGAFLLWHAVERPPAEVVAVSTSDWLSEMTLIGYLKRSHHAANLRGGSVTAVMGGVELDLRQAVLTNGTAYVDVVAFWGGIELKVPASWTVDARVVPMMGAFENKRDTPSSPGGPQLVLRGHAIMGAVVIGS